MFSYDELEEATKGFDESQRFDFGSEGTTHMGVLKDGSLVAVQKISYGSGENLVCMLNRIEFLSTISHKNIICLVGCCIELENVVYVVYEYYPNGSLESHLLQSRESGLEWHQRVKIAAETADVLAYFYSRLPIPIPNNDLKCSDIFLDNDHSVKMGGYWRLNQCCNIGSCGTQQTNERNEVYSFGVVLLQILMGSKYEDPPSMAMTKIRDGRLNEVVDPALSYGTDQPLELYQLEKIADLATRCLLFSEGEGKMLIEEVAKEVALICKTNVDNRKRRDETGETFSSSSLLQMISVSPDSIYLP